MLISTHNFDPKFHKDIKGVTEKLHILDRIIDRNEVIIKGSGSPITLWKFFPFGPLCTCSKDKKCTLCYGTGFLNGYQKYGYYTYSYGTTSVNRADKYGITISNNIYINKIPYDSSEAFQLTSGTSGYIETQWIPTESVLEHTYLKCRLYTPQGTGILYSYTSDGEQYTAIPDIKNLDIPQVDNIKIRLALTRTSEMIPSPAINAFKYRVRVKEPFKVYDHRFDVLIPAFLASKQYTERTLSMTQEGQVTTLPAAWWALPDAKIGQRDIGKFLGGNNKDKMFEFQNIKVSEHAENQRVLHTNWTSRFIFSPDDVLGGVYNLD